MNKKILLNVDSLMIPTEENSINTLLLCIYELSEEDGYENSLEESIDSSDLVEDSDDEAEIITQFRILNKRLDKIDRKNDKINIA